MDDLMEALTTELNSALEDFSFAYAAEKKEVVIQRWYLLPHGAGQMARHAGAIELNGEYLIVKSISMFSGCGTLSRVLLSDPDCISNVVKSVEYM